jgi:BCD family chlorophyll transporter-like MFS transporter
MKKQMTTLSWLSIVRLGLVQLCLGAIVVITTSTLNRLMVVELALPAVLPGLLVGLHYAIQITRPNWGYKSDTGGNRTRFIILGMAVLALGAFLAALGLGLMAQYFAVGLAVSVLAYALIGLGVGAAGTSLLALLATSTAPHRRAAAATITWLMMIFGIAFTATMVGRMIEPYSTAILLKTVAGVGVLAVALTTLAIWGIEARVGGAMRPETAPMPYRQGMREIWGEPRARAFTLFIFVSMVAYFMQELILEPYAGLVFQLTPGQTTQLSGAQNGGVFVGMLLVGIVATGLRWGSLRAWIMAGCIGSAGALVMLAMAGQYHWGAALLQSIVIALGLFNGMFAVSAIGSMMALAGEGRGEREGTRMGLWGASQAIAAGAGGLFGAAATDMVRHVLLDSASAFGAVFLFEAALFGAATVMAARIIAPAARPNLQQIGTGQLMAGE